MSSLIGTLTGAGFGVVLMILLFVCVTLHELGHSLVARVRRAHARDYVATRRPRAECWQRKPVCQDQVELVKFKF